jgi:hypothetical protein
MYDSVRLPAVLLVNVLRITCNLCFSLYSLAKQRVEVILRGTPLGDIKQYVFSHGMTTTGNKVMLYACVCMYVFVLRCLTYSALNVPFLRQRS